MSIEETSYHFVAGTSPSQVDKAAGGLEIDELNTPRAQRLA